jgi:hypothetical protein
MSKAGCVRRSAGCPNERYEGVESSRVKQEVKRTRKMCLKKRGMEGERYVVERSARWIESEVVRHRVSVPGRASWGRLRE